jgi:F0F1-type ATP synthase delta subunit
MSKLISFAGVSRVNGELKFRGAQSVARITQLQKLGDTEVEMRFLNGEMTKSEAAKRLIATNFANGREDILALLVSVANDDNPFAKPKKAAKPRTVVAKNAVVKTSVKSKVYPEIELTPKQAAKIRAEFMKKLKAAYEAN